MKAIKTDIRSNLSPATLDILMRISMHDDDIYTFDVNKATARYLQSNHLRCDHDNDGTAPPQQPQIASNPFPPMEADAMQCVSVRDEAAMEVQSIEQHMGHPNLIDHTSYHRPPIFGLLEKKPNTECIAIIKRGSGKALTAFGDDIGLLTLDFRPNQLWYIFNNHFIVSNVYGKVLQRKILKGQPVQLSMFDNYEETQKWIFDADISNHLFKITSIDNQQQLDVLGTVVNDGTWVGAKKKDAEVQVWSFEMLRDYYHRTNANSIQPAETTTAKPVSSTTATIESTIQSMPDNFKIVNLWEGNPLTVGSDGYLYVKPYDPSEVALVWSKVGNFIVAQNGENGKVLQANGAGNAVSLEHKRSHDLSQQWIFHNLRDGRQNFEIRCLANDLRLDLIEDGTQSDVLMVGANVPNQNVYYDEDTWHIEPVILEEAVSTSSSGLQLQNESSASNAPIKIVNVYEGKPLIVGPDGYLYVKQPDDPSKEILTWFRDGNFIVGPNGKVVQANGPGGPVTLENKIVGDFRQHWIFHDLQDGRQNYEIRCLHGNLRLDLIEDPSTGDVIMVGVHPANPDVYYDRDTWQIQNILEQN